MKLPIGYINSYLRVIPNKGHQLVNDIKEKIIGNICMDYMMIDITACRTVILDTDVTLHDTKNHTITSSGLAKRANTIPYEIVCNAERRSKLCYLDGGK